VDLDGDNIADLISGSYSGGVSFFKGLGKGKFDKESKLIAKNVAYESHELALSPCGGDWDGDGDADMAVGQISGPIRLMINDGKGHFTKAGDFTAEGKTIAANDGGPCIVDWTGDGVLDLLIGDAAGNVHLYAGKEKGKLDLAAGQALLPIKKEEEAWKPVERDPKGPGGMKTLRPGVRVKPFAADWNGDGKLDLLLGDFTQIAAIPKKLTAAEKTRLAKLKKEMDETQKKYTAAYQKAEKAALKSIGEKSSRNLTPEKAKVYQKAFMPHYEKEIKALKIDNDRQSKLYTEIGKLEAQPEATGFVWVYLRK